MYTKRGIFPDRWDAEQLWESEGRLASVDRMIPVVPSLSFSSIHQMQIPTFQSPAETRPWHFTHASISDLFTSNYTLQLLMGINVLCIFQSLAQLPFCATHCAKWSKTVVYENPSKFFDMQILDCGSFLSYLLNVLALIDFHQLKSMWFHEKSHNILFRKSSISDIVYFVKMEIDFI